MTVIGMGKLGGRELNFSSDIDIIYFYESDKGETSGVENGSGGRKGVVSLHAFFNKLGEMISKALSQVTEDGFVFRVDVGLRPEGKSGDMAVSLRSAEIYYESWGQSWERTAMLKARPVAGSLASGRTAAENAAAVCLPQISRLQPDRGYEADEAEDRCLADPFQGRGDQPQAGAGRHPRDRVFHPGPATGLCRQKSRNCASAIRSRPWIRCWRPA